MFSGYITDVDGIEVGHKENLNAMTGCSVIIAKDGATGGVDVRGSAPGTRETDLFQERKTVDKVHAVVLSGGSAFGLDASSGVMKYLEEKDIGFDVGIARVPIVSSAVIFDLSIGDKSIRPDFQMGYDGAKSASKIENRQGNVGAGAGATVGKALGPGFSMKSGLGSASVSVGDLVVGAMVSVNAVGDIFDFRDNSKIAGVYDYDKKSFLDTIEIIKAGFLKESKGTNTTIGVIATNAILTKSEGNKIAEMGHNAFARCINPVHTTMDGDTIFALGTNKIKADINLVGILGIEAMMRAIVNAIKSAKSFENFKSYSDII
ncbi:MAG: P1 family peptidase [Tissierellia bacterium]|nr:P1 family peptidase [Tissierellia bacterium]